MKSTERLGRENSVEAGNNKFVEEELKKKKKLNRFHQKLSKTICSIFSS